MYGGGTKVVDKSPSCKSTKETSSITETNEESTPAARPRKSKSFSASELLSPKKARKASPSHTPAQSHEIERKSTKIGYHEDKRNSSSQSGQGELIEDNRTKVMQATVKAWREKRIYISKGVTATQEKILSQDCVCVVGVPGSGKSTAIHHAALSLEHEGFIIYSIHGPEEFLNYFDEDKKQVFILDDVLGIYSIIQDEVRFWVKHNDDITNVLGTNTKLLVSIRTQLYNQVVKGRDFVFIDKSTCIDLCDKAYRLDTNDMIGMLTHYLTVHGVENIDDLIEQIWDYTETDFKNMAKERRQGITSWNTVEPHFSHCFPLLCKVFCSDEFVKRNPRGFFTNPFQALTKLFQNIKSDNKLQFCGLVLCAVFDGKLTEDMFSVGCEFDEDLEQKSLALRNVIMASCDLEGMKYLPQIKSALNSLDGVYVTHVENTYQMAHRVFHDVVIYLFNDTDPSFVLKYGTSEFIRDRIRLVKTEHVDDPYMIIINDDKNIERLGDRLFRDLKSDIRKGARFIAENSNIGDDRLFSSLKIKLYDIGQNDKELIDELFRECMKYLLLHRHSDKYKQGDVTQYKLIELCVQTGADCNMNLGDGRFPLHISVWTGSLQLTQLLLHNGADKRRVHWDGNSVLHLIYRDTKYNKYELIKLLTQHGEDHSVVRFITDDRQRILQESYGDNLQLGEALSDDGDDNDNLQLGETLSDDGDDNDSLQLEEVLPDNSIKVLTTDKHKIKHYVENCTGKLQLVERVHDNILTYIDWMDCNILHWSVDDSKVTRYVLGLMSDTSQAVNQRDREGRTPYWYVVNKQHPWLGEVKLNDKDRKEMVQLFKDNHAVLYDSSDDSSEEDILNNCSDESREEDIL